MSSHVLTCYCIGQQPNFIEKYTNPAKGILDFCKQKFYRPLLIMQPGPWTLYSMYYKLSSAKAQTILDCLKSEQREDHQTCTNLKKVSLREGPKQ